MAQQLHHIPIPWLSTPLTLSHTLCCHLPPLVHAPLLAPPHLHTHTHTYTPPLLQSPCGSDEPVAMELNGAALEGLEVLENALGGTQVGSLPCSVTLHSGNTRARFYLVGNVSWEPWCVYMKLTPHPPFRPTHTLWASSPSFPFVPWHHPLCKSVAMLDNFLHPPTGQPAGPAGPLHHAIWAAEAAALADSPAVPHC